MFILLKKVSAENISEKINQLLKKHDTEVLKKIENNNKNFSRDIESLKKDNIQYKKQILYLETLLEDLHNNLVQDRFCPICNSQIAAFLPFGEPLRQNAQCPKCGSLERHRLIYLFLKEKTNIFKENIQMLHIAPEKMFAEIFLGQKNIDYLPVDLNDKMPYVQEKMDIQKINYPNNTFDLIYCSHVLEHVPDDTKALKELYRVLKPNGKAIILVPIDHSLKETYEDPTINTPDLRLKHYCQSDHLRRYGLDFEDKLKKVGFNTSNEFIKSINAKNIKYYGINIADDLFDCTK